MAPDSSVDRHRVRGYASGAAAGETLADLVRAGNGTSPEFPLAPGSAAQVPNSVNRSQKAGWNGMISSWLAKPGDFAAPGLP
jgi:hypothetical protein